MKKNSYGLNQLNHWLLAFTTTLLLFPLLMQGQTNLSKTTNAIVEEGKLLYRLESANWYGTGLVLKALNNPDLVGGFFSYPNNDSVTCVYYSKDVKPLVLFTVTFDSTYITKNAKTDVRKRAFSKTESTLYQLRVKTLALYQSDPFFKKYKKTNTSVLPLVKNGIRKVYIITESLNNNNVILGNDYLLTFDSKNVLKSKKSLHKNIILLDYKQSGNKEEQESLHSHTAETGDYITATDICILMLYKKYTKWKQHTVVSTKYVSIWNFKTDMLTVLPRKAVEKALKSNAEKASNGQ